MKAIRKFKEWLIHALTHKWIYDGDHSEGPYRQYKCNKCTKKLVINHATVTSYTYDD